MNSIKENYGWQRIILLIASYIFVVGIFQIIGYLIAGVDFLRFKS